MILDNEVTIKWNNYTKNYYINLGYEFTKCGDVFTVSIHHLQKTSSVTVNARCDICGNERKIYYYVYNNQLNNNDGLYLCNACANRKKHDIQRISIRKRQMERYRNYCAERGYTPLANDEDYWDVKSELKYLCPKHGEMSITLSAIDQGHGCIYCGFEKSKQANRLSTEEVVKIVESKNHNRLLNPEEYVDDKTKNLKIICGSCGNMFVTCLRYIRSHGGHCLDCGKKISSDFNRLSISDVKETIENIGAKIINPNEYKNTSIRNLRIICPNCGKEYITSYNKVTNRSPYCRNCTKSHSVGEIRIKQVLDKHLINYSQEHSFKDCRDQKPLPFDFYLKDYNTVIEFDGQQHFMPKYGEEKFIITQKHDEIKNKYCNENKINIIRIPFWEGNNIEAILKRELRIV